MQLLCLAGGSARISQPSVPRSLIPAMAYCTLFPSPLPHSSIKALIGTPELALVRGDQDEPGGPDLVFTYDKA
jgi:hypothetical protein